MKLYDELRCCEVKSLSSCQGHMSCKKLSKLIKFLIVVVFYRVHICIKVGGLMPCEPTLKNVGGLMPCELMLKPVGGLMPCEPTLKFVGGLMP
jgi:hypothetical protein